MDEPVRVDGWPGTGFEVPGHAAAALPGVADEIVQLDEHGETAGRNRHDRTAGRSRIPAGHPAPCNRALTRTS